MKFNNRIKLTVKVLSILFLFSSVNLVMAQANGRFVRSNSASGAFAPVYVEGYLVYDSANGRIISNIVLKRGNKHGKILNGAKVLFDRTQLGLNSSGAFTGSVNASGRRNVMGPMGNRRNRNNINLSIVVGGRNMITVSDNVTTAGSMRVVPVYRTGIDVGEPVTVFWDRPRGNRNQAELLIVNANNGNLIMRKIMRSDRFVIPSKKLPPRKTVLFRVRMFVRSLALQGNVAPGSYINLYSGGEFRVNTHR